MKPCERCGVPSNSRYHWGMSKMFSMVLCIKHARELWVFVQSRVNAGLCSFAIDHIDEKE